MNVAGYASRAAESAVIAARNAVDAYAKNPTQESKSAMDAAKDKMNDAIAKNREAAKEAVESGFKATDAALNVALSKATSDSTRNAIADSAQLNKDTRSAGLNAIDNPAGSQQGIWFPI